MKRSERQAIETPSSSDLARSAVALIALPLQRRYLSASLTLARAPSERGVDQANPWGWVRSWVGGGARDLQSAKKLLLLRRWLAIAHEPAKREEAAAAEMLLRRR